MIWHYTTGQKVPAILTSGVLVCATAGVPPGERPAVWFSTNPWWERTANKVSPGPDGRMYVQSREETEALGNGLFRFQVEPDAAPYTWQEFKRLSGISQRSIRHMERRARALLALPDEWRVSFDAVPRSRWTNIEIWAGQEWRSFAEVLKTNGLMK